MLRRDMGFLLRAKAPLERGGGQRNSLRVMGYPKQLHTDYKRLN